jgi:hypothetical protein
MPRNRDEAELLTRIRRGRTADENELLRLTAVKAALAALPYVHMKPERAPATDPAATAGQIKGGPDPLYEAIKAWQEGK